MIEYIFFESSLQNSFVEYVKGLGIDYVLQDDPLGLVVAIQEDIDETTEEALETRYAALEQQQIELLMAVQGGLSRIAGLRFELPNGQTRMVPLEADIANRLMAAFSLEEIQSLFATVARSATSSSDEHLCKISAKN